MVIDAFEVFSFFLASGFKPFYWIQRKNRKDNKRELLPNNKVNFRKKVLDPSIDFKKMRSF